MSRGASSARWSWSWHEAAAVGQQQMAALAAHRLGDQEGLGVRVVQAGRVELDELHVGDPAAGAPGHGDAVAGRGVGIGRVQVDLAGAAGGQHGVAGARRFRPRRCPCSAHRRRGSAVPGRRLRLPVMRSMATCCSKVSILGWARTRSSRLVCTAWPVASAACTTRRWMCPPSRARWRPPGACGSGVKATPLAVSQAIISRAWPATSRVTASSHRPAPATRVSCTCASTESPLSTDRGDPALRPVAGAVGHLPLGDNGDAALVGEFERGGQRGEAAAKDEDVVSVHGDGR